MQTFSTITHFYSLLAVCGTHGSCVVVLPYDWHNIDVDTLFLTYEIMPRISKTQDSDELMAVYMKAVEDGDSVGQIIYGRLIAMT